MKYQKLCRLSCLFTLLTLLTCLLTVSAFAGNNEYWGYQQLKGNQKDAYERIEAVVAVRGEKVDLTGCQLSVSDRTQLNEVLHYLIADHPEYYWFLGDYGGTQSGGMFRTLTPVYDTVYNVLCCETCAFYEKGATECSHPHCLYGTENPGKTDPDQEAFKKAVEGILDGYPEEGSDYEKAIFIHDALANHIEYDYNYQLEQSAYSAIVDGHAVCAGYARAYQYLLNQVGIDAWTVEGYGWNPQDGSLEAHAWNLVWIDGNCVYTDVTWDDQTDSNVKQVMYAYFNRSLEEISEDHMTDLKEGGDWVDYFGDKLPKSCNHDEESYFAVNGINEISDISIETLATNVKGTGEAYLIHVLYDDFDDYVFYKWLTDNGNANMYALVDAVGANPYAVTGIRFTCMDSELRITIDMDSYEEPQPALVGYINDVTAKGKMTAYVNYKSSGLDLETEYETVMVAFYDEEDALVSVDFTTLELNEHGHGKLEASSVDSFSYCRIFVVDSDDNPAPQCDFLELLWTR